MRQRSLRQSSSLGEDSPHQFLEQWLIYLCQSMLRSELQKRRIDLRSRFERDPRNISYPLNVELSPCHDCQSAIVSAPRLCEEPFAKLFLEHHSRNIELSTREKKCQLGGNVVGRSAHKFVESRDGFSHLQNVPL